MTREEWENRWQESEGEYRQRGDHAALLALAEAALKEWPGDRAFRFRRANEEYQLAARTEDGAEREKLLHLSEGHFSEIVGESPDNEDAGAMLVQILLALGRRGEAEALARKLPHKEKLELLLRQGTERERALRREIAKTAVGLLNLLQSEGSREACTMAEAILASAGEPKTLIWYHLNLRLQQARLACGEKADAALEALGEMVAAAKAYAAPAPSEKATSFFSKLPETAAPSEVRHWIADALAEECFASLREVNYITSARLMGASRLPPGAACAASGGEVRQKSSGKCLSQNSLSLGTSSDTMSHRTCSLTLPYSCTMMFLSPLMEGQSISAAVSCRSPSDSLPASSPI